MEKEFLIAKNGLKFQKYRTGGLTYSCVDQEQPFHSFDEVEEAFKDICKNNIIYPDHEVHIPHCPSKRMEMKITSTQDPKAKVRITYVQEAYYSYTDVNITHIEENNDSNYDY